MINRTNIFSGKYVVTLVLFFCLFAIGLGQVITYRSLNAISSSFNISSAQTGLLLMVFGIGMVSSLLIGGYIAEIIKKKRVVLIGLSFWAVSLIIFGKGINFPVSILSIFFAGIGYGFIQASVNGLISDMYEENRGFAMNWLHIFITIGCSLAPWIAGFFLNKGNWHIPYYITAGFSIVLLIMLSKTKIAENVNRDRINFSVYKELFKNKVFMLLCFSMFFYISAEVGIGSWICTYLEKERNFSINEASAVLSFLWAIMIVGRIISGWLSLKVPYQRIILYSVVGAFFSIICGVLMRNHLLIMFLFIIVGLFFSSIFPTILAFGNSRIGKYPSVVSGILIAFAFTGSIFSYLMGIISEYTGYGFAIGCTSIPILAIIVIFSTKRIISVQGG